MPKATTYGRVSTAAQEEGSSIELQMAACIELVERSERTVLECSN